MLKAQREHEGPKIGIIVSISTSMPVRSTNDSFATFRSPYVLKDLRARRTNMCSCKMIHSKPQIFI